MILSCELWKFSKNSKYIFMRSINMYIWPFKSTRVGFEEISNFVLFIRKAPDIQGRHPQCITEISPAQLNVTKRETQHTLRPADISYADLRVSLAIPVWSETPPQYSL